MRSFQPLLPTTRAVLTPRGHPQQLQVPPCTPLRASLRFSGSTMKFGFHDFKNLGFRL